jgi:hypothetical protein
MSSSWLELTAALPKQPISREDSNCSLHPHTTTSSLPSPSPSSSLLSSSSLSSSSSSSFWLELTPAPSKGAISREELTSKKRKPPADHGLICGRPASKDEPISKKAKLNPVLKRSSTEEQGPPAKRPKLSLASEQDVSTDGTLAKATESDQPGDQNALQKYYGRSPFPKAGSYHGTNVVDATAPHFQQSTVRAMNDWGASSRVPTSIETSRQTGDQDEATISDTGSDSSLERMGFEWCSGVQVSNDVETDMNVLIRAMLCHTV